MPSWICLVYLSNTSRVWALPVIMWPTSTWAVDGFQYRRKLVSLLFHSINIHTNNKQNWSSTHLTLPYLHQHMRISDPSKTKELEETMNKMKSYFLMSIYHIWEGFFFILCTVSYTAASLSDTGSSSCDCDDMMALPPCVSNPGRTERAQESHSAQSIQTGNRRAAPPSWSEPEGHGWTAALQLCQFTELPALWSSLKANWEVWFSNRFGALNAFTAQSGWGSFTSQRRAVSDVAAQPQSISECSHVVLFHESHGN